VLVLGALFLYQIRFPKLKLGDGHWTKLRNHGGVMDDVPDECPVCLAASDSIFHFFHIIIYIIYYLAINNAINYPRFHQ
jgi:hypothetical protein